MQAAVLHILGDTPRFESFPAPEARDNETLVRVNMAAIKPLDRAMAAGRHYSSPMRLPVVCGMDGVGLNAAGERVYFVALRRPFGAMAEVAPAQWTVPLPEQLDDMTAAAIVNPALSAWLPLACRAEVEPGETVLVLGATSAAGRMAVQAARLLGAGKVIAAGRRLDVLATLGADAIIDLRLPPMALHQAFAGYVEEGIDVVIDFLWGEPVEVLIGALLHADLSPAAPEDSGIRLVSVGEMAGNAITLPSAVLRGSRLKLMGSGVPNFPPTTQLKLLVEDILAHASDGDLAVDAEAMPLAQVAEAWRRAGEQEQRIVLAMG